MLSDPKNNNSLLSDKVLTAKAIFLTTLASGDKSLAIAALSFDSVILTENEMVIGFVTAITKPLFRNPTLLRKI